MKLFSQCLVLLVAVLACAGCGKKEVTQLERKQGVALVSEAQFALTLRDYARAEGLLAQATKVCHDDAAYWIMLGSTRVRLGQRESARDAYEEALDLYKEAASKNKTQTAPLLQQVYVLALLGRIDDARALEAKLQSKFPEDRDVRAFIENKQLDRVLSESGFKQIAL